jgi:outer membrane receptor protein involved in Fe transport
LTDRGTGIRLAGFWRSSSTLLVGAEGANNQLRFEALGTVDLTVFASTQRLFPGCNWAQNGRISIAVTNIANARQKVFDSQGLTPLSYQPAYLDAVGRTIMLELRKIF